MKRARAYMAEVDFQVLGTLQARADPAAVRGQRARDVLAVLLLRRGRPVPPELILDLVWSQDATRLDASVVHTVIARLRRSLGHAAITRHDAGYHLAQDTHVDADEFARLVTAAQALVPERQGEIVHLLRRALALWTGPEAYAGVSDSLVVTDRPRLHELRDTAIEQLAERLLATGDPPACADAVLLAGELVAREPLRERAHELLMEGLYRTGRQAEALAAFDRLRTALRDELGIDPSPATAALHARILAQDITIPARMPRRPARGRAPRPRTATVDRQAELRLLADELAAGRSLVTIVGPGGVGKSRLLVELAGQLPGDVPHVYAELPCTEQAGVAEVAESIARAAGLTLAGSDPLETLATTLGDGEHLLLLDEAEWSLPATVQVLATLLSRCPRTRIVVTSRVPLALVGEYRLQLRPLPAPPPGATAAQIRESPAVRLLLDRLDDHAPDLRLDARDVARVAEIARRVDGLPLALEIVAGQAASSSVPELLALGEAPLDLTLSERDRDERQRSLRETLMWSIERLTPPARSALCRLSVFDGPFDMAAAEAVVGHVPVPVGHQPIAASGLVRLLIREAQLQVERRGDSVQIRMLRTVQALARELLAGDEDDAMRRHRQWYAARWRDRPLGDALVRDLSASYPDYLAALRRALAERDRETLGDLAIVLSRYWFFVETGSEGVRLVRAALGSGVLGERHTAILRLLEVALLPQDRGVELRAGLDDLTGPLAQDADWLARLHILRSVGRYVRGDFASALECTQAAVAVARERAEHHLPEALGAMAVMLAALGRADDAVAAATAAWRLIAAAPSAIDLAQVVPKVALALIDSDHPREALNILDRAIDEVDARLGVAPGSLLTINAGWAALGCAEPAAALTRFAQSLDQLTGGGDLLVTGEIFAGAGAAMAARAAPGAADVLAVAEDHLRAAGVVLSPWQRRVVERHRRLLGGDAGTVLITVDLAEAARLVRQAAAQPPPAGGQVTTDPKVAESIAKAPRLPGSTKNPTPT